MATLLMRTPELSSSADSLGLPNHARLHVADTAPRFSRLPQAEVTVAKGQGQAPCSGRSRRAKSVHKKQPQRGLGVAQLEKLRLQEQSKQEAACLASFHASFPEQCATSLCFQASANPACHVKAHLPLPVPALSLATSNDSPLTSDTDASGCIVSLGPAHSFPGSSSRQVKLGRPHDDEAALPSLELRSPGTPVVAFCLEKLDSAGAGAEAESRVGARLRVCPPNAASLFPNVFAAQGSGMDAHVRSEEQLEEARRQAKRVYGERGNEAPRINGKDPLTFMDLDYYDSDASHLQRSHRLEELSSFQSFSSNQVWSSGEKILGRKRPWGAMQDRLKSLSSSNGLDLNAESCKRDVLQTEQHSTSATAAHVADNQPGVHYTTGIVRTALGQTSCLPIMSKGKQSCPTSQRQDSGSPSSVSGCLSEMSVFPVPALHSELCTVKDSCSSASPNSTYSVAGRIGGLEITDVSDDVGISPPVSDNDFLSLGLSSCAYLPPEHYDKEGIRSSDGSTQRQDSLKHSMSSTCINGQSSGKVQLSLNCKEQNCEVATDKKSCSFDSGQERNVPTSSDWTGLPSTPLEVYNKTHFSSYGRGLEDDHELVHYLKKCSEDSLDLSLKLAL